MLIIDKEIEGKVISSSWTKKQITSMSTDAKNKGKVLNYTNVVCVHADGEELEYILYRFSGIPSCFSAKTICATGGSMSWYGDIAKFIVGNWI